MAFLDTVIPSKKVGHLRLGSRVLIRSMWFSGSSMFYILTPPYVLHPSFRNAHALCMVDRACTVQSRVEGFLVKAHTNFRVEGLLYSILLLVFTVVEFPVSGSWEFAQLLGDGISTQAGTSGTLDSHRFTWFLPVLYPPFGPFLLSAFFLLFLSFRHLPTL